MKKQKLQLQSLKLQSFVTKEKKQDVKGGDIPSANCFTYDEYTCACTHDIWFCLTTY